MCCTRPPQCRWSAASTTSRRARTRHRAPLRSLCIPRGGWPPRVKRAWPPAPPHSTAGAACGGGAGRERAASRCGPCRSRGALHGGPLVETRGTVDALAHLFLTPQGRVPLPRATPTAPRPGTRCSTPAGRGGGRAGCRRRNDAGRATEAGSGPCGCPTRHPVEGGCTVHHARHAYPPPCLAVQRTPSSGERRRAAGG